MKKQYKSLKSFIAACVQGGRNCFCFEEALAYHGGSKASVQQALYRLVKAHELFSPKKDFYVIVPLEYQKIGSISSLWFIDGYMKSIPCSYYVGLLSAAAMLGAGHQQPQGLQVITSKQRSPLHKKEAHIQFYTTQTIDDALLVSHKTPYGYVRVSSPALTLLDLFRFPYAAGYMNNIATVMGELADQITVRSLTDVIDRQAKVPHIQRMGYMSAVLGLIKIEQVCATFIARQKRLMVVSLNPQVKKESDQIDNQWKININDTIESD